MSIRLLPVLFITDIGRCHPKLEVCGMGSKPFDFIWDDKRSAHVREYESLEAFLKEQPLIVGRQKSWPIYFDVVIVEEGEDVEACKHLKADLQTAVERIRFLEAALAADPEEAAKEEDVSADDEEEAAEPPIEPATPAPSAPPVFEEIPATFNFPPAPDAPAELEVPPPPAETPAPAPKSRRRR